MARMSQPEQQRPSSMQLQSDREPEPSRSSLGSEVSNAEQQMIEDPTVRKSGSASFPVETWESIFWNLTAPGDLYNVALASYYIRGIATPILYRRVCIDPNPYLTYTLCLFKREAHLMRRVTVLTFLARVWRRDTPSTIHTESKKLLQTLDIPHSALFAPALRPSGADTSVHTFQYPQISAVQQQIEAGPGIGFGHVFRLFPKFTNLTTLNLVEGLLPSQFLWHVFCLGQLTTLSIRDSLIPPTIESAIPTKPLLIQSLSILGCSTKVDPDTLYNIPRILCEGLIETSPDLTSLFLDLFMEHAACHLLSRLENPPPIRIFTCHGPGKIHEDLDCILLRNTLAALPTITSLYIARTPPELGVLLPPSCLPNLTRLTGQIKSLAVFTVMHRPLQYLTITDAAMSTERGTPWETQLIHFLESLKRLHCDIKGLSFNLEEWSEEVFLCICQTWPGLRKLVVQCTTGQGVDEYFRISFGPRFLPQLQALESIHIYKKTLKYNLTKTRMSKGVSIKTHLPLLPFALDPGMAEELAETPIHLRRWGKLCPSLREVAFDREIWWRRIEPGGWVLRTDALPLLVEDAN